MLWWATGGRRQSAYADVPDHRRGRVTAAPSRPRRAKITEQLLVGGRQIKRADHGVGDDPLPGCRADTGHPALSASAAPPPPRRRSGSVDAGLLRDLRHDHRDGVDPALGEPDALDAVHVGDHGVERERGFRRQAGVHGLEAEQPMQPRVGEPSADCGAEPPEGAEPQQLGESTR